MPDKPNTNNQSFVRTPHARRKHQPRTASKMQNNPITTSGIAAHKVKSAEMMPPMSKMAPVIPRAMRPWKLMFRSKNRAMCHINLFLDRVQIFGAGAGAGGRFG